MPIAKRDERAIPIPGTRRQATGVAVRQRWDAFTLVWARTGAHRRAYLMHLRFEYARRLSDRRIVLYRLLEETKARGPWSMLCSEIEAEIRRVAGELGQFTRRYSADYIECAYSEEKTVEETALRLMLDVGTVPHRLAGHKRDRTIERRRDERIDELKRHLDPPVAQLAEMLRGGSQDEASIARIRKEISLILDTIERLEAPKS